LIPPPENHLPQVSNPNQEEIHHGRQITEIRSQTGDAKADQGIRCRSEKAAGGSRETTGQQGPVNQPVLQERHPKNAFCLGWEETAAQR
jgi:hypothetical protein